MKFFQSKFTIALLLTAFAFGFNLTAKAQTITPASELVGVSDIPASNLTASLLPYPNLIADRDDFIALYSGSKYLDLYCAFWNNCPSKCRRSRTIRCKAKHRVCTARINGAALKGAAYGSTIGGAMGAGLGGALAGPFGAGVGGAIGAGLGGGVGAKISGNSKRRACRHRHTACYRNFSRLSRCISNCNAASSSRSSSRFQRRWRHARSGRRP